MTKETFESPDVAPPVGPYSQAVRLGGLLFLSGQVALEARTGKLAEGGVSRQAEVVLDNLGLVLKAAGKDWADVARVGIYLADMADFAAVNEVYAKVLAPPYPARTTVAVRALPLGAAVEMDLVAA